jgi:hypothetical protein
MLESFALKEDEDIEIDLQRHNAHNNLGVALAQPTRMREAAKSLILATELCPTDPCALIPS